MVCETEGFVDFVAMCDGFAVRVGCANDDVVKFLRSLTRADSF